MTPYCFFNFTAVSIVESCYSDEVIVDINRVLKSSLTVIDGFVGMEGSGAVGGDLVKMDLIIAGEDPVAMDATACRIMVIDLKKSVTFTGKMRRVLVISI